MENLYTAIILFVIALNSKYNQLTYLMITGCLVAWLIDSANFDIALYYCLNAVLFSLLSLCAININSNSALTYAIIVLCQMFFCLTLIPSWGDAGNSFIQNTVTYVNDDVLILILLLGISGSDNVISNGFNNNRN